MINIISMISVLGVMIGTAALIIVLSVFNGFEHLILRLYNSFEPDLKITAVHGKSFGFNAIPLERLQHLDGVARVAEVLEENALVKYKDKQYIATIKGVSAEFAGMTGLDSMMVEGEFILQKNDTDYAVLGGGIAYNLNLQLGNFMNQVEIYAPRKKASSLINPEEAFNRRFIQPSGIFSVQQEFDTRYIIVPLRFANEILEYDSSLTSLEIALTPGADKDNMQEQVQQLCGSSFQVKNRYQQHELIYKIMKSEKWAVFLILTFILIIAIFNVISSLTMLVIDKKKDLSMLQSMGAGVPVLRKIFLMEGIFITLTGAAIGLFLGFVICLLQQQYGFIKLGGSGAFVIDSYPVHLQALDFLYVLCTVLFIGLIAAWYPSRRLIGNRLDLQSIRYDG